MRRQRIAAGVNRRLRFAVVGQSRECGDITHLNDGLYPVPPPTRLSADQVCMILRVVTRSYSLSQLSLLKAHETLVPSVGRFQSADRIIGHNHPSGDILPSSQDRAVTRSLANAGKVLGVPLHDHLIIGMNGKRFSFAESLPDDLRAT